MRRRSDSVAGPVLIFAGLGLVVLILVGVSGVLVLRRIATEQALDEARQGAAFAARVIERRTTDELLVRDGDAGAQQAIESAVFDAVLFDPVVRVRLLAADGTIVYADDLRMIGQRVELGGAEQAVLTSGEIEVHPPSVSTPPIDGEGELVVVTARISTPDGVPLLLQLDQRLGAVSSDESDLLGSFAPVLLVALAALALLLFPLAYVLARRVQQADRDRERLLQRALDSTDRERRKLAADLHDGPVQDLAGLSMQLAARAEAVPDGSSREALQGSADAVRESVRVLRAAIVDVYPPNLRTSGLGPALSDLIARARSDGIEVVLDAPVTGFGADADELLYRACQEGLRNVVAHAEADRVEVQVRRDGRRATLTVSDDGRGVDPDAASGDDHLGLKILEELVGDAGGVMSLRPRAGGGTVMRVEVPVPR